MQISSFLVGIKIFTFYITQNYKIQKYILKK